LRRERRSEERRVEEDDEVDEEVVEERGRVDESNEFESPVRRTNSRDHKREMTTLRGS
jgi:hypothetical protein